VPCFIVLLGAFFPRVAFVLLWIFSNDVERSFDDSFLLPLLGLIFLPFTALVYVLVWVPGTGVDGLDWLWIGLALVLDLSSYGGGSRYRRRD